MLLSIRQCRCNGNNAEERKKLRCFNWVTECKRKVEFWRSILVEELKQQ